MAHRSIVSFLTHEAPPDGGASRSEEHTSELQSLRHLVCRLLLEKKNCDERHDGRNAQLGCLLDYQVKLNTLCQGLYQREIQWGFVGASDRLQNLKLCGRPVGDFDEA